MSACRDVLLVVPPIDDFEVFDDSDFVVAPEPDVINVLAESDTVLVADDPSTIFVPADQKTATVMK